MAASLALPTAQGADRRGKWGEIDASLGVPQLLGCQLAFLGIPRVSLGLGIGFLPGIDGIVNGKYPMKTLTLGDPGSDFGAFELSPVASYSLLSAYLFLRFFPSGRGFFFQAHYAHWIFQADLAADLKNKTLGLDIPDFIEAEVLVRMPIVGLQLGYQWVLKDSMAIDLALGGGFLFPARTSIEIGGLVGDSASAKSEQKIRDLINNEIKGAVADIEKKLRIHPGALISIGYLF